MKKIEELGKFIAKSVSPFHTANAAAEEFQKHGFEELVMGDKWNIQSNNKYFVRMYDSSITAFTVGNIEKKGQIRIVASHSDFPCFKIKPAPELIKDGYSLLNTEVYGGPILNTWLDRPLSIAGMITVKGNDAFNPEGILVNCDRPVLTIPNLAIHMNRNVNKGIELNKQKDILPITDTINDLIDNASLIKSLADIADVSATCILDYELYIYQYEAGDKIGFNETLYSSPRLDNITSVMASINALINSDIRDGINMTVIFDNEEIGSRTKQGAASELLSMILEKIYLSLNQTREDFIDGVMNGFMVSTDVAHGLHPSYPEKNDVTNKPVLNGGPVLKISASQSYANDSRGASVIRMLSEKCGVNLQTFVNRSDMPGGSTLGSITSANLPMRTIDIGIPLLAMHSARETMGVKDQESIEKLLTCFFS